MKFFDITPELIEKAHWRYERLIRENTNKRIALILKYAGYSVADLACFLEVDEDTIIRYMKDFSKMPIKKLVLLGRLCNVRMDYFPDMWLWHNRLIDDMKIPETDA